MAKRKPRIGIALGAGSARGWAHIGALQTLVGAGIGFLSVVVALLVINVYYGGLKFPIAFFSSFMIPLHALWWGPVIGAGTAILGSFFPAVSGMRVKVSEVFAKVA